MAPAMVEEALGADHGDGGGRDPHAAMNSFHLRTM